MNFTPWKTKLIGRKVFYAPGFLLSTMSLALFFTTTIAIAQAPTKSEILGAIGRKELSADTSIKLEVKPWKYRANAYVAIAYATTGTEPDIEVVRSAHLLPTLVLFELSDGKLKTVARTEIQDRRCKTWPLAAAERKAEEETPDSSQCTKLKLDLAAYQIRPSETAIGLRTTVHEEFGAGESEDEYLALFQISGSALKQIFSREMKGYSEERGPGEEITTRSVLRVSEQATSGFFDLLVVENVRRDKLSPDDGRPIGKTKTRRFIWKNGTYTEVK